MSDEEFTPIQNVDADYLSGRAGAVDDVEIIPHQEVVAAAEAVVRAAAQARTREFIPDGSGYVDVDSGELLETLYHTASDQFYVPLGGGRFQNTTTLEVLDRDPREPDESQYQWIIEKFEYFHERWPAFPRTMAEQCQTAQTAIMSGEMSPYEGVGMTVSNDWAGLARDDFLRFFLNPFGNAVTNQQLLLTELSAAMYAYEAVLRQGRLDARHIADETVNVLDSIGAYSGGDAKTILRVIGIGLAVVSTLATAGSTTALTFGLIGAGLQTAQLGVDIAEKDIAGETVDEVLRQLEQRLEDLRTAMDAVEDTIADAVAKTADSVEGLLASRDPLQRATILPNEPNDDGITDITGGEVPHPDEFHPPQ
jgi:hypothetical protein